ncbi:hypothetical protein [Gordonia paraffinivorans]|uniref:hypothetical protein n=1 Tax=Gordonia paraffinivorans TaxID=175628 RepID=UPI003FCCC8C9
MPIMPAKSRIRLDADVDSALHEQSDAWEVLPAVAVALAVQAQSPDPMTARRAQSVLDAISGGTAVPWRDLRLPPSSSWTLTLSMGGWVDSPSVPGDPISRAGHGVRSTWRFNTPEVVAAVRAYWAAKPPTEPFRIVAFRLGLPVAHLWAESTADWGDRIYADKCLVEQSGVWVDADTGAAVRNLDIEDRVVSEALRGLIVVPSRSRNPVSWIKPEGMR